jgi:hypothetical protein
VGDAGEGQRRHEQQEVQRRYQPKADIALIARQRAGAARRQQQAHAHRCSGKDHSPEGDLVGRDWRRQPDKHRARGKEADGQHGK